MILADASEMKLALQSNSNRLCERKIENHRK